ncbi:uncharacterized protein LOC132745188 [Ruditapes philippinarum]|uniref:uncharacterized protein LOC132745188 n=1 Tax=Ruditapes philippinarum TaxID=129788 RepID=UPI00295BEB44|nr:uncharacterized protein LOC132745188 [Ruditapes philippinarum]
MVLKLLCMLYSVGYCVLGQYVYDYNNDTYDTTSYTYDDVNDTNQFYYDYYDDDSSSGKLGCFKCFNCTDPFDPTTAERVMCKHSCLTHYLHDITEGKSVFRRCGITKEDGCEKDSRGALWCHCTSQYCNRAENVKMQALMSFTVSAFLAAAKKYLF